MTYLGPRQGQLRRAGAGAQRAAARRDVEEELERGPHLVKKRSKAVKKRSKSGHIRGGGGAVLGLARVRAACGDFGRWAYSPRVAGGVNGVARCRAMLMVQTVVAG